MSLARGLSVIQVFGVETPEMTLSQVATRAGISRAAARRFLLTLKDLGYVAADGNQFRLTPKVLGLGYAYLSSLSLWEVAQPFMERVSEQVHESCSMSVLDGEEVVYVARVPTKHIMSVALGIGTRLPAHATSMGRVLLSALSPEDLAAYLETSVRQAFTENTVTDEDELSAILQTVRDKGYALVDQELEIGLRSIAVPVRDRSGRVRAALNASGHASRVNVSQMVRNFLTPLQEAAQEIAAALPH